MKIKTNVRLYTKGTYLFLTSSAIFISMCLLLLFYIFGMFLFAKCGQGQTTTLVWNTLQFPIQFSTKWQLHNDISYRTIGVSGSAYQNTFRTGIRRFIDNKWNVASGLAFFYTRTSFNKMNHEFGREFRLWQEVVKENKLNKKLSLFNRFRTHRWFSAYRNKYQSI